MIRVGFDVGGTFTDFVLLTDDGRMFTGKRLTSIPDPSDASLAGLADILKRAGVSWGELGQAVHGTTLGSNIVIERKGESVALATTEGFRDVLTIAREKRYALYDLQIEKAEPLIDRSLVWEIPERVLADGSVERSLDEGAARAAIREIRRRGIRSLAVCFLHSYRNPAHERRFAELAEEVAPGLVVSLSSEISPQFREYERTSTTVVNAYVMTAVREYLVRMMAEMHSRGYRGRLFIMQSSGGVATAESMTRFPVRMIESGPAGGAIIAAHYGQLTGQKDVVAFDMGGTTAKLAMIVGGVPETVGQFELHKVNLMAGSGIPMTLRSIDLVEIGAGGGSVAKAALGTIQVGPESAGAAPGPACYGLGGTLATVTDANLVLGYLSPSTFAGGTITLDPAAASEAIRRNVAEPLGMSVEDAAWGIHTIVNTNMEHATRVVSIERGHDPRTLALVATGGSGPAHACRLAQTLAMPMVIIPAAAGVASAIGMLAAKVKFDVVRTLVAPLADVDLGHLNGMFDEMQREADRVITESTGGPPSRTVREVELRYRGQGYELTVEVSPGRLAEDHLASVRQDFEKAYARRYGFSSSDQEVEATTWKLTAYGLTDELLLPTITERPVSLADAWRETRDVYFPEMGGYGPTPVYVHDRLVAGAVVSGPAVIEQRESTTVLPPGVTAEVDGRGNLLCRTAVPTP